MYFEYSSPIACATRVADEAIIPGHIQGTRVERINQTGESLPSFLARPTKTLSPVTRVYLAISMFRKNWKVIPNRAPQMIPKP